jgi:processive 1,2-diacylglycerol beta-glucosyltransferase
VHWDAHKVIAWVPPSPHPQTGLPAHELPRVGWANNPAEGEGPLGWPRRRVLLVPGSSSPGRLAAATACRTTLEALGFTTNVLDATWLGSHGLGPAAEAAVRRMLTVPGLHDALHFAALRPGNRLAVQADAVTRLRLVPRLRDYLDRHPVELVISISPAAASAVSIVAPRYPFMRHVVLCTDASPHRLWIHERVDLYLVRTPAAQPAVHRFQPDARVVVIPPPVRAEFYRPPPQPAARIGLGIGEQERCVLLVSGSRGDGSLPAIASGLAAAGLSVLAVAGVNGRLERRLRDVARRRASVIVFGFTERMPELMAASDLVITVPGSICMEARTVGRPLLLLDLVQGHGRDDLLYELELGNAAVTSKRSADVVRSALAFLERIDPPPTGPTRSLADWEDKFRTALETVLP